MDEYVLVVSVSEAQVRDLQGPFLMALNDNTSSAYRALHDAARMQVRLPKPVAVGDRVKHRDFSADHPGFVVVDVLGDRAMCRSLANSTWAAYRVDDLIIQESE